MFAIFYPDLWVDSVQHIDLDLLRKNRIRGLILDIDNTLVPQHMKEADDKAVQWLERVKSEGFKACIVSNASKKRVIKFNERLKINAIHRAAKPAKKAFLKAASLMELKAEEVAMVGDQVFTDVLGGKLSGMYTILVKPIDKREGLFIRLKRFPEKIILKGYFKKNSRRRG